MSELIHFFTPYAQEHVSEMHDTDLTFNTLSARGSNFFCENNLQIFYVFISLGKNHAVRLYICIYGSKGCVLQHEDMCRFYLKGI